MDFDRIDNNLAQLVAISDKLVQLMQEDPDVNPLELRAVEDLHNVAAKLRADIAARVLR